MGKRYKLNFERMDLDHPDFWLPYCMNSFGKGYSIQDAETMKNHIESIAGYRNVSITEMTTGGEL